MPPPILSRRPTGIHSLPVELLSRIFVLGAAFDYAYADSPFLLKPEQDYSPPPISNVQVIVSHVCHHWRQVALRTPSLWTTLHFREAASIPRAEAYLARCSNSSTYLLDILVDTVAVEDHTPGVTLYKDEVRAIFHIIIPHVKRWRAFHLKICDNDCKGFARQFLSACGPAPNLETLQLYHFENYGTTENLYIATYRPPVVIFSNTLPRLKNVSLIGVNLPWECSPYLRNLCNLELALHSDNIRPPYKWWSRMLRLSSELETLCLHYSGPRKSTGDAALAWPSVDHIIHLPRVQELSFTDLDPDYLCNLLQSLYLPSVRKVTLDLPDQEFSPVIELISGPTPACQDDSETKEFHIKPIPYLANIKSLTIRALECSENSWFWFLQALKGLRYLEVDSPSARTKFWKAFTEDDHPGSSDTKSRALLPRLEVLKIHGVPGEAILSALRYRHLRGTLAPSGTERWIVSWTEEKRGCDMELDQLVDRGCWVSENGTSVLIETFNDEDDGDEEAEEEEEVSESSKEGDGSDGHP